MSEVAKMLSGALEAVKETGQVLGQAGVTLTNGAVDMTYGPKGQQGSAELAHGLMSQSNAYVPYGAGQQSPNSHDHGRGMSR